MIKAVAGGLQARYTYRAVRRSKGRHIRPYGNPIAIYNYIEAWYEW